jgi:NAD(P)-dependent dehydrogenase (short-subunit alcohol dehydrogenase family)
LIRSLAPRVLARFEKLDLRNLISVGEFVGRLSAAGRAVDILVNQAGGISHGKRTITANGFELHFGANYLAHFALTAQLLPLLRRSRRPVVVQVTGLSHRRATLQFGDLQLERRYEASKAYSQSQLAMLVFAQELQRRSDQHKWGLLSTAAHPGYAPADRLVNGRAGLMRRIHGRIHDSFGVLFSHLAARGAQPLLFAATSPLVQRGGFYGPSGPFELAGPPGPARMSSQAQDPDTARVLWEMSERLTGAEWPVA